MSRPVRARRLTDDEGQFLLRLVRRRGRADAIRYRRGLIILASSSGTPVLAIARLVAADPDTVRDVIHAFNAHGLSVLEPHWGAGRPRRITDQDEAFVVEIARRRPGKLGLPFTHWSIRKLANYLSGRYGRTDAAQMPHRIVRIGRERVRRILRSQDITFQRTRTWKESPRPGQGRQAGPDRGGDLPVSRSCLRVRPVRAAEHPALSRHLLGREKHPDRLPATYHRYHGVRYFHGCYDLARDQLWGVLHEHKGGAHTLAALNGIRAARPDGAPIYIVLDNLSCNTTAAIRTWAAAHKVELCPTPTNASWADPIEAQFGPLRTFTMANSDHPSHAALARRLHAYLRWRNANVRDPRVLDAQRRERARVRSEKGHRWGRPQPRAA